MAIHLVRSMRGDAAVCDEKLVCELLIADNHPGFNAHMDTYYRTLY